MLKLTTSADSNRAKHEVPVIIYEPSDDEIYIPYSTKVVILSDHIAALAKLGFTATVSRTKIRPELVLHLFDKTQLPYLRSFLNELNGGTYTADDFGARLWKFE